jgi:hypothetical protein
MKSLIRIAAAGALSTVVAATPAIAECNNYICENVRIATLYTSADGGVYVRPQGNIAALNCTLEGGIYMTLVASSPRFKEIYANLMAYQLADRPISIRINEGSQGCTVAYVYTTAQ